MGTALKTTIPDAQCMVPSQQVFGCLGYISVVVYATFWKGETKKLTPVAGVFLLFLFCGDMSLKANP